MVRFATIKLAALGIFGVIASSVPATQGPTAAPAWAGPGCGGHNEKECFFPFNPCHKGLVLHKFNSRARGVCKRDQGPPSAAPRHNGKNSPTGLRMCNRSSANEIRAAIVYYDWGTYSGRANWTSEGWWTLRRGQCQDITLKDDGRAYDGNMYLMAESNNGSWEGDSGAIFCIRRYLKFEIKDADQVECAQSDALEGIRFEVLRARLNTFDFSD